MQKVIWHSKIIWPRHPPYPCKQIPFQWALAFKQTFWQSCPVNLTVLFAADSQYVCQIKKPLSSRWELDWLTERKDKKRLHSSTKIISNYIKLHSCPYWFQTHRQKVSKDSWVSQKSFQGRMQGQLYSQNNIKTLFDFSTHILSHIYNGVFWKLYDLG